MSDLVLSPEGEHLAREFAGHFQALYERLGEAEARVGQVERLLSIRLRTKLGAVPGGDVSDAAELLEGIREGVEIETIILDIGQRLGVLEEYAFRPRPDEADTGGVPLSGTEAESDDAAPTDSA